jgi:hypothetical protein
MTPLLFLIPLIVGVVLVVSLVLQLLWNSTFPDLFGWKHITLWTAFKLVLIAAILFGSFSLPFGYGTSSTQTTGNGGTITTNWSIGTLRK